MTPSPVQVRARVRHREAVSEARDEWTDMSAAQCNELKGISSAAGVEYRSYLLGSSPRVAAPLCKNSSQVTFP